MKNHRNNLEDSRFFQGLFMKMLHRLIEGKSPRTFFFDRIEIQRQKN
jgi:hypothetical protein